jgi:4-hydroxybenzoate polyprenyltransferase
MQAKAISPMWDLAINWKYSFLRELHIVWQFIWRDIWATIIPTLLFLVAAWQNQSLSFGELMLGLGRGFIYFGLYIFPFCIANQMVGIEEDKINKPDRPIITGLVSYQGAQVRFVASMVAYSLVGWWFGILELTLIWQICIILHNFGGWSKHWLTKDLIMGVGAIVELAGSWQLVTAMTPVVWQWTLVLAFIVTLLIPLQDFRDLDGDRAIGRNTFPIAFGESAGRAIMGLGFGLLPVVIHLGLMMPAGNSLNVMFWDIAQAFISWTIATRIVVYRTPKADHHTYMMLLYWYCLVLGSAIFVL